MIQIPAELKDVLVSTEDTLGGSVRFLGTRVPLQALLDTLQGGGSLEEFLDGWPDVSREQAQAVLDWDLGRVRAEFGLERAG
ncbi:hypothetical protein C0431_09855 [bacterium]|jgi:uncharacterized protein (DUF433 family)|nr:hypothetical protein [bacterium]